MFRRHWSGLPKDVEFASDLKGLGYFVNDKDEIRSIEKPDCYFQFFLNKNARVNDRQRFAFNHAMEMIIHQRLEKSGLQKVTLPLGTTPTVPHVPVFASLNLGQATRVVVIFGEPTQDLGMLAGRVANGPGGLDKGTMVSVVRALQAQAASAADAAPPGVVLANMGQLYWWPDEKRALTVGASGAIPLPSLVHVGRRYVSSINDIPGNESPEKHVSYLFKKYLPSVLRKDAQVDLICIGSSCQLVERYLDAQDNWKVWEDKLSAMLLLGSVYSSEHLQNSSFKDFLARRTRSYLASSEPLDTPLAPPSGNPTSRIEPLGCPSFSSASPSYTEMILIEALQPALAYLQDVALAGPGYENAPIVVVERPAVHLQPEDWDAVPEQNRPGVSVLDVGASSEWGI